MGTSFIASLEFLAFLAYQVQTETRVELHYPRKLKWVLHL